MHRTGGDDGCRDTTKWGIDDKRGEMFSECLRVTSDMNVPGWHHAMIWAYLLAWNIFLAMRGGNREGGNEGRTMEFFTRAWQDNVHLKECT